MCCSSVDISATFPSFGAIALRSKDQGESVPPIIGTRATRIVKRSPAVVCFDLLAPLERRAVPSSPIGASRGAPVLPPPHAPLWRQSDFEGGRSSRVRGGRLCGRRVGAVGACLGSWRRPGNVAI